ncbi:glycerate kinase family protein [Anaerocolumna xylanovorans]|uniref:Glycerate kinase n=1 Tax=Anaerocolumna xylanovorans DSM 12503 TaxID=1121345 RepID=A0A1M7YL61_9FIRM|nr:glycerate kinase [Anaerocolumna xylanovorans]SHO53342.1 glycerate kinase [Anaerocolumna xylanovorans DSM 12503]
MKVVVAMDSFKGSLTSMEAGNAVKEGIQRVSEDAKIIIKPLGDGGEGTAEALLNGMGGRKVFKMVTGPMGKPVEAMYGILSDDKTAVIEMAQAAGITLCRVKERNPMTATTFGVGEMILDAMKNGCRNFLVGIGGSATNDGGTGLLMALGYEFFDKTGEKVEQGGGSLKDIAGISCENVPADLAECRFHIACDVSNPLCGPLGATHVFGPQKGALADDLEVLEAGMRNYAALTKKFTGTDYSGYPGAGAAGGLGFCFLAYLKGQLMPGIEMVMKAVNLEEEIKDADYIITGEGRLDGQSGMGKAPVGVAKLAKRYGRKVIAFAGSVTREAAECNRMGIDAFFPVIREIVTLEEAMNSKNAADNLRDTAEQVFRLLV